MLSVLGQNKLNAWSAAVRQQWPLPLRVELWNGQHIDLSAEPARVTLRLPDARALRYLLAPSLYGLGRAYVEGAIEVRGRAADMIAIVNALARAGGPPRGWAERLRLARGRGHSRQQDAHAVHYHYDVSNAFYAHWLDPAMVYSCAYFENGDEDLASAQTKKIDHILAKIGLRRGQSLLDIGCGWGALVLRAAGRFGARCVGITLSENQALLARERVAQAGLAHLVEIRVQDYRDVRGSFERITSVGMFEHVGVAHLPAYFRRIEALLADEGVAMNHGLTSTSTEHARAPYGAGEFIERFVFPRGELAHLGTVLLAMQRGGLEAFDVENLRRHYARTCSHWSDNFETRAEQIKRSTDARRYRIWQVYLAGCAYAFEHDWISLYQIVCRKAGRSPSGLPWSRRYMYA
ncbi:MAG: cyclopropane-fatty-acyl-phospholipid synthase family protein [Pseudomonadota bacterium]